jgi:hypothetical protein
MRLRNPVVGLIVNPGFTVVDIPDWGAKITTVGIRISAPRVLSVAMGWKSIGGKRTVFPSVASSAILLPNSKNCVAWTIEYGIEDSFISFS